MTDSASHSPAPAADSVPPGVTHVSFDVFGTCLARIAGQPSELFRAIGKEIATRLGRPADEPFAEDFIEWRSEAERRARRRSLREEVSLVEIWRALGEMLGPGNLAGIDGPALEQQMEHAGLRPIAATRVRIARERAAGRKILFISDSYLPRAFLAGELRRHGFAQAEDVVHVSSESGLMKGSGGLFRHVLKTTPLTPAALHHIGDNLEADISAARRLGISAELFRNSQWKSVERFLFWHRPVNSRAWLTVAGELTAARLAQECDTTPKSDAVKFVEKFLGPFLCVFGHWVLRQAMAAGRERLYFASRDTQLLWRVCQTLNAGNSRCIDLRYLLISRYAIVFPAVREISLAGMPWLRRHIRAPTLPALLHQCELSYAECGDEWTRLRPDWSADAPLESPLDWAMFWRFLQSSTIRARMEAAIARRKQDAILYLKNQGLFDPTPMGFVDFGWFLTCQASLNRLMRDGGATNSLEGYYLGLRRTRPGPAETGKASAIFREGPEDLPVPAHLDWMRRHYILELIAGLSDHLSVRRYGEGGTVEYVSDSNLLDAARFREIDAAVSEYATACGPAWKTIADDDAETASFLGTLLGELFQRPPKSLVHIMQDIAFSPDPGRGNSDRLVEPYSWQEVLRSVYAKPPERFAPGWRWWPEASAAATPQPRRAVREAGRALRNLMQRND